MKNTAGFLTHSVSFQDAKKHLGHLGSLGGLPNIAGDLERDRYSNPNQQGGSSEGLL